MSSSAPAGTAAAATAGRGSSAPADGRRRSRTPRARTPSRRSRRGRRPPRRRPSTRGTRGGSIGRRARRRGTDDGRCASPVRRRGGAASSRRRDGSPVRARLPARRATAADAGSSSRRAARARRRPPHRARAARRACRRRRRVAATIRRRRRRRRSRRRPTAAAAARAGRRRAATARSTMAMPTRSAILSAVPNSAIAASFAHGGARSMSAAPIAANGLDSGATTRPSARRARRRAARRPRPRPTSAARAGPPIWSQPWRQRMVRGRPPRPCRGHGLTAYRLRRGEACDERVERRSPVCTLRRRIRGPPASVETPRQHGPALGSSAWVICSTATAPHWRRARRRPGSPRSTRCSAAPRIRVRRPSRARPIESCIRRSRR